MKMFGILDSSEKTIAILGDRLPLMSKCGGKIRLFFNAIF